VKTFILSGVAIGAMTFYVTASRAETVCPGTLAVQQRAEVPAGWSVTSSETPPRLAGIALFDGQPANRVSLKSTQRRQTGNETRLVWILPETPRSIYLQCSYERTSASIATPLPPGTTHCDLVFDRTATYPSGAPVVKRMVCK
jgi:hypothetical protein